MGKINIALVTGGDVAEREISLKSAQTVYDHLSKSKYEVRIIILEKGKFVDQLSGKALDLNDFSLTLPTAGRINFDLVYQMLHGHPAEDGGLQGYFELVGIPYTGCGILCSAITFSKQATKDYLRNFDIPMAQSRLIFKGQEGSVSSLIEGLKFPLFVKPNKNGSSYGVSKVVQVEELAAAVDNAFLYDDEVIVEEFMKGREFSNGVLNYQGAIKVLPITEIKTTREFFDYQAKYENESEEITPAELKAEEVLACRELTEKIYRVMNAKGFCRVDYILQEGQFKLLEINTIPGMSPNSIIPQQVKAAGLKLSDCLDEIIKEALQK